MRINYSDDEIYPGQFELWQANCRRSLNGKAGQRALRDLETALLALPTKRLIADELHDVAGDVCAIGALARAKGLKPKADPGYEMEEVGVECGMPRLVAWKVVEINDIELSSYRVGPEARYERVLAWVRSQLH